ncbi:PAS domain-containing protein [Rhodomicrobium udaipurense]|uniref:PAS domain-containing protein n=1 Tax=Rhodomicrobium udaipurense TaxID=1202716 RepID=A0A8I1GFD0_9HYPH|nr:PAS domain-containing protein [Rhodomicrobium udaipurense]MBJ7543548.1 hypothetical protein [Rhodomicrobium udaipurense]
MNPAARASFELRAEDFSEALPKRFVRLLARLTEAGIGGSVRLKLAGRPPLDCFAEVLHLADGEKGLVVAETDEDFRPHPALTAPPKLSGKPARSKKSRAKIAAPPPPAPSLTEAEMSAFKALGRKMKRLCAEKQSRPAEPPTEPSFAPLRAETPASPPPAESLLQVFDLVLFLGNDLDVVRVSGRAARFGWKKAELHGMPVLDLLADADRAILHRMSRRLASLRTRTASETLWIATGEGPTLPCRAALCRWPGERTAYALLLLALDPPQRLKRSRARAAPISLASRRAA